jgi:hypothetical protein
MAGDLTMFCGSQSRWTRNSQVWSEQKFDDRKYRPMDKVKANLVIATLGEAMMFNHNSPGQKTKDGTWCLPSILQGQ